MPVPALQHPILWSSNCATTESASAEKASDITALRAPANRQVTGSSPPSTAITLTPPWEAPVASFFPSLENTAGPSNSRRTFFSSFPAARPQIRSVLSAPTEATFLPPAANTAAITSPRWPVSSLVTLPEGTSQTQILPSVPVETSLFPSSENAKEYNWPAWRNRNDPMRERAPAGRASSSAAAGFCSVGGGSFAGPSP